MQNKRVVHLTIDLMAAGRLRTWAAERGHAYLMVSSVEGLSKQASGSPIELLAVDLQLVQTELGELARLVQEGMGDSRPPNVIGYGQHVEESLLNNARNLDFCQVMTRGQFMRFLDRQGPPSNPGNAANPA